MFHRIALRLRYGHILDADRLARRRKMRIILLSGVAVYPPFLFIAYRLYTELNPQILVLIGLLSSLTCIPVGLYAYAAGFGQTIGVLWRSRREEMVWFSLKIGFLYPFLLYWMILGMVEFFFGYHAFRAALISFVASAIARDGFEIGYLAARPSPHFPMEPVGTFPDGRSMRDTFRGRLVPTLAWIGVAIGIGVIGGIAVAQSITSPRYQALAIGLICAAVATPVYRRIGAQQTRSLSAFRYFLWPGLTMGCSYFFILAYLLRVVGQITGPSDAILLTAACCTWSMIDALQISWGGACRERLDARTKVIEDAAHSNRLNPMPNLAPVSHAHYPALCEFLAAFDGDTESPKQWRDHFRFWWDENPVGKEADRGWVLTIPGGRIVGFIGVIPTEFQCLGERSVVLNATTWRVAEDYRAHSLKLFFRMVSAAKETILFNTTPNRNVAPILDRLKFQKIPAAGGDRGKRPASVLVLSPRKLLKRKLGGGGAGIVATIGAPLLNLVQWIRLDRPRTLSCDAQELHVADSAFDDLWERTRARYPNTAVRSSQALNWYCFGGTTGARRLVAAFAGERLVGHAIFRQPRNSEIQSLECVDLWTDPDEKDAVAALVFHARKLAQQEGHDLVLFPHFNATLGKTLAGLGLFSLKVGWRGGYFYATPERAGQIGPSNSFFTDTQGDATFFP
jgi:hypothetical protein